MSSQFSVDGAAIPLVVGVTGHRDIREEHLPLLKERISGFLKELQNTYKHTPIILMSPLAEGADCLAARAAMELKKDDNVRLVVPLPFEQERYERTFTNKSIHKKAFDELLLVAEDVFVNPLYKDYAAAKGDPGDSKAFAILGNYVARNCHILLALWDGVDNQRTGGTAHVVKAKLNGNSEYIPSDQAFDIYDTGVVYHVVTPRESTGVIIGEPFSGTYKYPNYASVADGDTEKMFKQVFANIDNYNRQLKSVSEEALKRSSKSFMNYEHENGIIETLDSATMTESLERMLDKYFGADALAGRYMARRHRDLNRLTWIGMLSFLCFELYGGYSFHPGLAGYMILFATAIFYYFARTKKNNNQSLDFRALAEGLRIQFFCRYIGSGKALADKYLRQRNEVQWVSYAIRGANLDTNLSKDPDFTSESLKKLMTFWIYNQIRYFKRKISHNEKELGKLTAITNTSFLLTFLAIILLMLSEYTSFISKAWQNDITFAFAILIILSVAMKAYTDKKAYTPMINTSRHMVLVYQEAYEHLSQLATNLETLEERILDAAGNEQLMAELQTERVKYIKKVQDFIAKLGEESLEENAWWVVINRDKSAEVVIG